MEEAAKAAYPGECCGILLGKTAKNSGKGEIEILETREAPNLVQGEQKSTRFEADPLFLYQVEREIEGSGLEIVGFYHSHPDCEAIPSREDAEKMVRIGDKMTFNSLFEEYPNNLIMGKALDNRVGCYVMMEVLKRVDTRATVYGVGTVQEEVGLKGAKTSAFKLNPDLAIALDVTLSGDHPGIKPEEAPVVMGKGPAIILADASGRGILTQQSVKDMLIKAGDENEIPYQLEVSDGGTTDGTAIHLTREGIPTGVLSVPTRYIHTPVSVCSMDDIEYTIQLITEAINNL